MARTKQRSLSGLSRRGKKAIGIKASGLSRKPSHGSLSRSGSKIGRHRRGLGRVREGLEK